MKRWVNVVLGVFVIACIVVVAEVTLGKYFIDADKCIGCGVCVEVCPQSAIMEQTVDKKKTVYTINKELCNGCGVAKDLCPVDAIKSVDSQDACEGSQEIIEPVNKE